MDLNLSVSQRWSRIPEPRIALGEIQFLFLLVVANP